MIVWLSFRNRWLMRWKLRMGERMVMACAFGGAVDFLGRADHPVTLLARTGETVERMEVFACDPRDHRLCHDRASFRLVEDVEVSEVFGAGIHRLVTKDRDVDRCYFVRAYVNGKPRDSDVVRSKIVAQPTRRREGGLRCDPRPAVTFVWAKPQSSDFWATFLLVTVPEEQTLVTGIYSWDSRWTFPDVSRTPFYYHPLAPEPRLQVGKRYEATYFAVDRDGWIPELDTHTFSVDGEGVHRAVVLPVSRS